VAFLGFNNILKSRYITEMSRSLEKLFLNVTFQILTPCTANFGFP